MPLPVFSKSSDSLIPQQYILDLGRSIEAFLQSNTPTYFEAGAYNGIEQSNTLILNQKLGWRGLLVEPVPHYYRSCIENRLHDTVVNALLVEPAEQDALKMIMDLGPMSSIQTVTSKQVIFWARNAIKRLLNRRPPLAEFSIQGTTIDRICNENNTRELNFISLDIEGFEHNALLGATLNRLNTLALLIECRQHMIMDLIELLIPQNYVLADAMSRFNKQDNPQWDGTHQDYLFLRRDFMAWMENNER